MSASKKDKERFSEIRNNKVFRNYHVGDKFEAGIKLQGTEIKAVREGQAQINESFVRLDREVPVLYHAHIPEYSHGTDNNHNPVRPRKLLLHKREILRLKTAVEAKGNSIIPTRMYLKSGLLKVEIAICKGKKLFDKREDLKEKSVKRETERAIRSFR